ncbi:type VI secretion system-associated protein TagK [Enterobacter sp. ENT03]|uniref:type VI secretion system-associated protein TagK n=1 Tax=Enterobacter sp. ENT03 TaxID=2854780 RepID=UPI001C468653|nr:type VI secretion system-associated protein TagK [Enterobacter sp. ENT03]MBV7407011.1 type VI secretion system-associated protein TagK [Enterobacter sp. ENT03]
MKHKKTWALQKIQVQGIRDDTLCPVRTEVVFTDTAPWVPVFGPSGKETESEIVALRLIRYEEAWWIINYSDEWCCAVNEQIVEPQRRMRLNDGDIIEWGLSSWRLVRHYEINPQPRPESPRSPSSVFPEPITEFLDLDWFRQQHINPQDPFDIIPVCGTTVGNASPETDNTLVQLYQEYQQALLSPEQETRSQKDPFPLNGEATTQDLTSLYNRKSQADTLQDMVAGTLSIDDILDSLDTTGDGETAWPAADVFPDILLLLSPLRASQNTHHDILPDLTQREHRIIGIDSHYRINAAQNNGDTPHEKK